MSKIFNTEVFEKKSFDAFNFLKIISREKYVINIDKYYFEWCTFYFGKKGIIRLWLLKISFTDNFWKWEKLISQCLLKAIQKFVKLTHSVLPLSMKTWWRFHVHLFIKGSMNKSIFDIQLIGEPISSKNNYKKTMKCHEFCCRRIDFLIIDFLNLTISLCDKTSLITLNISFNWYLIL